MSYLTDLPRVLMDHDHAIPSQQRSIPYAVTIPSALPQAVSRTPAIPPQSPWPMPKPIRWAQWAQPILLFLSILWIPWLSGCGADHTPASLTAPEIAEDPTPRLPTPPTVTLEDPLSLQVDILEVTWSDTPSMTFRVSDLEGFAMEGLREVQVTLARLLPGLGGETPYWYQYPEPSALPLATPLSLPDAGAGETITAQSLQSLQFLQSPQSLGILEELGNGYYRYPFTRLQEAAATLSAATSTPATAEATTEATTEATAAPTTATTAATAANGFLDPWLTHRIGLELPAVYRNQPVVPVNAVYTFQPATGLTQGIPDRRIVTSARCTACHGGSFTAHAGRRVAPGYCVTCHQPGLHDAVTGEDLDFRVLMHKIHRGEDLQTPYVLTDAMGIRQDYSTVRYPQDIRTCSSCHDPDDPATPEASWTERFPTASGCQSCHDAIDFTTGLGHGPSALPVSDNQTCSICHVQGGLAGSVPENHARPEALASARFQWQIHALRLQPAMADVEFSILDPVRNQRYTIPDQARFLELRLRIDWTEGSSTEYRGPTGVNVNLLTTDTLVDLGNGRYQASIRQGGRNTPVDPTLFVVAADGLALETGRPVRMAAYTAFFDANGNPSPGRRDIVHDTACQQCHGEYQMPRSQHGDTRTDHVQSCVVCHNIHRVADLDGQRDAYSSSTDFLQLIHGIHASEYRNQPYRLNDAALRHPRSSADCLACHTGNSHELTSIPAQKPATRLLNVPEARFASPQTAVCWSCHNRPLAEWHMRDHGGQLLVSQAELLDPPQETCTVCHAPGQIADLTRVHGGRSFAR